MPGIGTNGYPYVKIQYDGIGRKVDVHKLVAEAFMMKDYSKYGICCMHRDDDKMNPHVDNLELGSYSQNNKDSYGRGRNPGNGLKKC